MTKAKGRWTLLHKKLTGQHVMKRFAGHAQNCLNEAKINALLAEEEK